MTDWLHIRVTDRPGPGRKQAAEVVDERGNVLGELKRVTSMTTVSEPQRLPVLTITLNVTETATEA